MNIKNMRRSDYMDGKIAHHDYYLAIAQAIGLTLPPEMLTKVRASTDEHLNDVPLAKWDALSVAQRARFKDLPQGEGYSLGFGVCALKALARHLRDTTDATDDGPMTLQRFIQRHGITIEIERTTTNPNWTDASSDRARHWRVTLTRPEGAQMTLYFSQGSAITTDPTALDVLECLLSDAAPMKNSRIGAASTDTTRIAVGLSARTTLVLIRR